MTRLLSLPFTAVLLLNLTGCGEDSAEPKVESVRQSQLSEPQVVVARQAEEGPPCGELELSGSSVLPEEVVGAPSEPRGGAIEDGIYRVVGYRVFGEIPELEKVPFHQTARFSNGASTLLLTREAAGKEQVSTYAVRLAAAELELTGTCPDSIAGAKSKVAYTLGAGRLLFQIDRRDGLRTEIVYERVNEDAGK